MDALQLSPALAVLAALDWVGQLDTRGENEEPRHVLLQKFRESGSFDLNSSDGITDAVFRILRNAKVVRPNVAPDLVICWGGHSIPRDEYDFTKEVGHQLGLRGFGRAGFTEHTVGVDEARLEFSIGRCGCTETAEHQNQGE